MPGKKWNPSEYDEQSILQYRTAMSMLHDFSLTGNENILDVGCGSGKISHQLARKVSRGHVTGLDINHDMIKFARKKYQATGIFSCISSYFSSSKTNNLSFDCQDIVTMDYKNCFDVVVSFWTLSWVPKEHQVKALQNIVGSLKEGGRLLLMYPMRHDAYDVVNQVIVRDEWKDYFVNYEQPREFISEEFYRNEIINQISITMHVTKKEIACDYTSDKEMIDSINCWLGHVDVVPEEKKEKFLISVAEAYKKHRGINKPTMYYSTLEITGQKPIHKNILTNNTMSISV